MTDGYKDIPLQSSIAASGAKDISVLASIEQHLYKDVSMKASIDVVGSKDISMRSSIFVERVDYGLYGDSEYESAPRHTMFFAQGGTPDKAIAATDPYWYIKSGDTESGTEGFFEIGIGQNTTYTETDANLTAFVRVTADGGAQVKIKPGVVLMPTSSAPSQIEGMTYYDDTANKIKFWDGAAWNTLDTGTGAPDPHGAGSHSGAIFAGANDNLGAFYLDIGEISAPSTPASDVRRLFVNSATNEISVVTDGGATVSLEGVGGGPGSGTQWDLPVWTTTTTLGDSMVKQDSGGTSLTIEGSATIDTIAAEATDVDKFLVSNAGLVKFRTGAEAYADMDGYVTADFTTDFAAETLNNLGTKSHDDLDDVSVDDHHSETHVLAVTGPHTGTLPLTDLAAGSQGSIIYRDATDWAELTLGTNTYVLKSGATDVAWGQVDYSELVGTQPAPVAHVLATTGPHSGTLPLADLAVGSQGSVIIRGAADWEELTLGTTNYALVSGATDVAWTQYDYSWLVNTPSTFAPSAHVLAVTGPHTGALPLIDIDSYAQGSLIIGGGADWEALAKGTVDQVLTSDGTDLSWEDPAGGGPGSGTQWDLPVWDTTSTLSDSMISQSGATGDVYVNLGGAFEIQDADDSDVVLMKLDTTARTNYIGTSLNDAISTLVYGTIVVYDDGISVYKQNAGGGNSYYARHAAALGGGNTWRAFYALGDLIDPEGASATIVGLDADYTGTLMTNNPDIYGVRAQLPATYGSGTEYAGYFTGDGRTVAICDDTYAIDATGEVRLNTINAAVADHDKFLVSDTGVIEFRTGAEVLSDIGAATVPLALTDLASYVQGSIIIGGGADWEAYALGTTNYVLKAGATDVAWGQVDYSEIAGTQPAPVAHNLIDTTGHPVSGLTGGHFLKADTATTYSFQVHGLTASDVGAAATLSGTQWTLPVFDTTTTLGDSMVSQDAASASATKFRMYRQSTSIGAGMHLQFQLQELGPALRTYAQISGVIVDNTASSIDGEIQFWVADDDTITERMVLDESGNLQFDGTLTVSTTNAGVSDYDAFLVSDSGLVKFRTGAEAYSDMDGYVTADFTTDFAAESLANLTTRAHSDLSDAPTDAHHNEDHVLATTGPHSGTLPLTDLAAGAQGSVIIRGAADWEELGLGTNTYVLKSGATDVSWSTVDWTELTGTQPAPVAHNLIDTTGHPVSSLTSGHFLKATGTTTYAFEAHGLTEGGAGTDTTAIHDNVANEITAITPKTTLGSTDEFILEDGGASFVKKAVTFGNLESSISKTLAQVLAAGAETDGANIEIDSGGDLIIYSDDGVTEVGRIDGATGHIGVGKTADASYAVDVYKATSSAQINVDSLNTDAILNLRGGSGRDAIIAFYEIDAAKVGISYDGGSSQLIIRNISATETIIMNDAGGIAISGATTLSSIAAATSDLDKFLVSDSGEIKFRTGAEAYADMDGYVTADFTTDFAAESLANLTTRAHSDLSDAPTDAHHNEAHVLAVTGPHTGTLPLADLEVGSQGSIIYRDVTDWAELTLGTSTYVLKSGATDVAWGQVDYSELVGTQPAPVAHVLATTGPHSGTLPLTDLAAGTQGSVIIRGAADWEELGLGTSTYVLKSGATDVSWSTVDWGELTGTQPAPMAHVHDTDTLQIDAVNSDGGAFSFTTTGAVTFNQAVTTQGLLTADGLVPEGDLVDDLGTALLTWQSLYVQDLYDAAGNQVLGTDGTGYIDFLASQGTPSNGDVLQWVDGNSRWEVAAQSGGGGITGSGTNNQIVKWLAQGSTIQDSIIADDGSTATIAGNLTVGTYTQVRGQYIQIYETVNDGNPYIQVGSSTTNDFFIQTLYNSGTQVLDYAKFITRSASATADDGRMEFHPDSTLALTIHTATHATLPSGVTIAGDLDVEGGTIEIEDSFEIEYNSTSDSLDFNYIG